jgi:hypothetical protein
MKIHGFGWVVLLGIGCSDSGTFSVIEEGEDAVVPELVLVVDAPLYGQFVGDGPVSVSGKVSPPDSVVQVEDLVVQTDEDGLFSVEIPVDYAYRIIDVQAELAEQVSKERIPVFGGMDPLESWPGGLPLWMTDDGLARAGALGGAVVDGTGWDQTLLDLVPLIEGDSVRIGPTDITHDPTEVILNSSEEGLAIGLSIDELELGLEAGINLGFLGWADFPGSAGIDELAASFTIRPWLDEQRMLFIELVGSEIVVGEVVLDVIGIDLGSLADGLDLVVELIDVGVEALIDGIFGASGEIPLGGPWAFELDLLGDEPLAMSLDAIETRASGIGMLVGISLDGEEQVAELIEPSDDVSPPEADALLGLHDGLAQPLLDSELLALLEEDMVFSGILADIIEISILALDGAPVAVDVDGWCLGVEMGDARLVRLGDSLENMANIYLPDAQVTIGQLPPGATTCQDWLVASLAIEVGLEITEGTEVAIQLEIPEGAVLYYEADFYDEDEVIEGLGGLLESSLDLLGGSLAFDLSDLLGGELSGDLLGGLGLDIDPELLDAIELQLVDVRADTTSGIEGMSWIVMSLFAEPTE